MVTYQVIQKDLIYDEDYYRRDEQETVLFEFDNKKAANDFVKKHSCRQLVGRDIIGELFVRESKALSMVEEAEKTFRDFEPTPILDAKYMKFRNGMFVIEDITSVEWYHRFEEEGKCTVLGLYIMENEEDGCDPDKDFIKLYLHEKFDDDLSISCYFNLEKFCNATGTNPETNNFRVSDLHFYDTDKREIINWQNGIVRKGE